MQHTITGDELPEILEEESSSANLKWMEHMWSVAMPGNLKNENASNGKVRRKKPSLHRVLILDFLKSLW